MTPSVGRIVHYRLNTHDVSRIVARRDARADLQQGNSTAAGDVFPMVIVRVWGNTPESAVNGQVLLDGYDTLWVTSVTQGDGETDGQWSKLPRV